MGDYDGFLQVFSFVVIDYRQALWVGEESIYFRHGGHCSCGGFSDNRQWFRAKNSDNFLLCQ